MMNISLDLLHTRLHLMLREYAGIHTFSKPFKDLLLTLLGHSVSDWLISIWRCVNFQKTVHDFVKSYLVLVFD